MNGRIYDPTLGRFLQADPFIQAPKNSQSYNRYAYVFNNPLKYIDPSGYSAWTKFRDKILKPIAAIVVAYYTGQWAQGWAWISSYGAVAQGAIVGAAAGGAAGFVATGSLKGTLQGAFTGVIFGSIGASFDAKSGFWAEGGAGHIGAHALAGGIISDLQGGNFGHGFWSAGLTKAANVNGIVGTEASKAGFRVALAAVIGGTISKITGGKFANGATTAAFAQTFNGERGARRTEVSKKYETLRKRVVSFAKDNPDSNIPLSNEDIQTIRNQMTIDASLAPKYSPLSDNWEHQFGTFDTFIFNEGLASRNFIVDGEIYSGGNINYIGVGALFRAYGYGPHGAAIGTTYWNVKQYMSGEGTHNLHQIYKAQPWTMSGYYNGITETGAF